MFFQLASLLFVVSYIEFSTDSVDIDRYSDDHSVLVEEVDFSIPLVSTSYPNGMSIGQEFSYDVIDEDGNQVGYLFDDIMTIDMQYVNNNITYHNYIGVSLIFDNDWDITNVSLNYNGQANNLYLYNLTLGITTSNDTTYEAICRLRGNASDESVGYFVADRDVFDYYVDLPQFTGNTLIKYLDLGFSFGEVPQSLFYSLIDVDNAGYDEGYDHGYYEGYDVGYDKGWEDGLSDPGNMADYLIESWHDGYDDGYAEGFRLGRIEGETLTNQYNFRTLFGAIADTPILFIRQLLGFEVFGVQAVEILMTMITGVLVLYLFRKIVL